MALDGGRAEHYRSRARLAREMAERTMMPGLKQEYELIAEEYEKLAQQVEAGILKP